ncbi:MAG TPA: hypothetical protein VGC09_06970 [Rhodopila sp.]
MKSIAGLRRLLPQPIASRTVDVDDFRRQLAPLAPDLPGRVPSPSLSPDVVCFRELVVRFERSLRLAQDESARRFDGSRAG